MSAALRVEELTPRGRGGVSVLRVSGSRALDVVGRLVPRGLGHWGEPVLARIERDRLHDEVIVCAFGEMTVELHAHGNPAIVEDLRRALGGGSVETEPARRNQAELAAHLLASAVSESGARILLDQTEGALERDLDTLRRASLEDFARELDALVARSRVARYAIEPAIVVIAGPVNAGKSTLFNALLGTDRATVSDEAGTTRDALRETALLGRYPVEVVDTAGERALEPRDSTAPVERAAQALAREWSARSELVLWLAPLGAAPPSTADDLPRVVLASRVDQLDPDARPADGISALTDPGAARARVAQAFRVRFTLPAEPWQPGFGVVLGDVARARLDRLAAEPPAEARAELDGLLEVGAAS